MILKDIKSSYYHPLNKKRKIVSLFKYFKLGIYMRFNPNKMFVHSYIHGTKLLVGKKSTSSMLQYLNGLNDFEEMGLLLHFLTENDIFVDVGANIGVYSILSSGVANARSIAIEPSDDTIKILKQNIELNNLQQKITYIKCVVGSKTGKISFTKNQDAINRVVRKTDSDIDIESIKEETLDNVLNGLNPSFIKIDVEGFEVNVLKGAANVLAKPELKIILIETNGLSSKYNLDENEIFTILKGYGFSPYYYSPLIRKLTSCKNAPSRNNTIFIRDIEVVSSKIRESQTYHINKISF